MRTQAPLRRPPSDSASLRYDSLQAPSPQRVLAIDGDLDTLMLYQESLGEDGFIVDVATDPLPLDTIRGMRPDLLLLECRLAGLDDGCVLLRQVRHDPVLGQIPCVVCTCLARHAHGMADTLAAWDVPVLPKPFDFDALSWAVHAGLDRAPLTPVPTPATRTHRLTPQGVARLHNRYISALWRGDDVQAVTDWLEAHWARQGPPEPATAPEAVSLFGGTGSGMGIRWYHRDTVILGYPPGPHPGCYQIPITDMPPVPPGLHPADAKPS